MITDANVHSAAQVSRCLQYLALWHASAPPGATPMELFLGRTA